MLEALLQKLGIESFDDLTPAERATCQQWATVLSKPDVKIDDLKTLLLKSRGREFPFPEIQEIFRAGARRGRAAGNYDGVHKLLLPAPRKPRFLR